MHRQGNKPDPAFRTYVTYFAKRWREPEYEQQVQEDGRSNSSSKMREASRIMEDVVSINARRLTNINKVKSEAKKRNANIFKHLILLEHSDRMEWNILKEHAECSITKQTIPFPREVKCMEMHEDKIRKQNFIVRSDFIPLLKAYFVLYHFSEYLQKKIDERGEEGIDETFIEEQYKTLMHCIKTCKMMTHVCDFLIQDIY